MTILVACEEIEIDPMADLSYLKDLKHHLAQSQYQLVDELLDDWIQELGTAINKATGKDMSMELNEYGMKVWKHKTNKRLFLQQSFRWVDRLTLIDETEGRQIIMDFKGSTFDYYAWTPMTKEEYDLVKLDYKEIYNGLASK